MLLALLTSALVVCRSGERRATQVVDRFAVEAAAGTLSHPDRRADIVVFQQNDTKKNGSGWNIYGHSLMTEAPSPSARRSATR